MEQKTPTEDKAKVTIIGSHQEVDVCKKAEWLQMLEVSSKSIRNGLL